MGNATNHIVTFFLKSLAATYSIKRRLKVWLHTMSFAVLKVILTLNSLSHVHRQGQSRTFPADGNHSRRPQVVDQDDRGCFT